MDSGRVSCCYICIGIWNGLYEHEYMKKVEVEGRLRFNRGVVKDCLAKAGCICEIRECEGMYIDIRVIEMSGMVYGLYRISIDSLVDYIYDIVCRNI